jgi:hypothetical protein
VTFRSEYFLCVHDQLRDSLSTTYNNRNGLTVR